MAKKKIPWGVKLNVAVLLLSGSLALLGAFAIFTLGALSTMTMALPVLSILGYAAFIIFLVGIFEIALAYGLWNLKPWAWWILVIFGALGILSDVVAMFSGTISIFGTLIAVVLLAGLLHKDTIKSIGKKKIGIDWKGWKL